jgi:hypothetical protein
MKNKDLKVFKQAIQELNNSSYSYKIKNDNLYCYQTSTEQEITLCALSDIIKFDIICDDIITIFLEEKWIKLTKYGPAFFI